MKPPGLALDPAPAQVWHAHHRDTAWRCAAPSDEAIALHHSLDGYSPTPLVNLPSLATELGVGHVLAKDESSRLGLPAFKGLGASWAVHRALAANVIRWPVSVMGAAGFGR